MTKRRSNGEFEGGKSEVQLCQEWGSVGGDKFIIYESHFGLGNIEQE